MGKTINKFTGSYYFLSNFYMAPVTYEGVTYTNNEAAFQAQKCADPADRPAFANLDPSVAKKKGRHVKLREDWETIKRQVMFDVLTAKFTQNPVLRLRLQATGNAHLEEGNDWGDRIWGTVDGEGENWLGKLLMQVRTDLHREKELILITHKSGWYSGYKTTEGGFEKLFYSDEHLLFANLKKCTDEGYTVTCIDKYSEGQLMAWIRK